MASTCEELNVALNTQMKEAIVGVVGSIKTYVDGKDSVLKTELKEELVKELSQIDGLGEQLEKIQGMADAFSKVFDENEDGAITPEEILAKAVLLQQAIDGVNGRVDALTANTETIKKAIEEEIESLKSRVSALELSSAQNRDEIAAVKADLGTNYASKECVESIISIKVDDILSAVEEKLNPTTEEEGDGATL